MRKSKQALFLTIGCFAVILSCEKGNSGKIDTKIAVSGISISQTSLSLTGGETANLTATVSPSDANNKNYSWSSTNSSVATVDKGSVTAAKEGSATITVKTASCQVTVNSKTVAVSSRLSLNKSV